MSSIDTRDTGAAAALDAALRDLIEQCRATIDAEMGLLDEIEAALVERMAASSRFLRAFGAVGQSSLLSAHGHGPLPLEASNPEAFERLASDLSAALARRGPPPLPS